MKARKQYICWMCYGCIEIGEKYHRVPDPFAESRRKEPMCADCYASRYSHRERQP